MYAIKCKQLIDGTGKESLENAVIVIEGERITQAGLGNSITLPDDCEIVDASSHTVMPGMMDAHVHVRMTGDPADKFGAHTEVTELAGTTALKAYVSAKRDLESGFTAIRDIASRCYEDIALRNAINEGLVQGPRMRVAGLGLTVTGGHMDRTKGMIPGIQMPGPSAVVDSPDEARKAVREQLKMGVDLIKINSALHEHLRPFESGYFSPEMTLEMIEAIVELAHWAGRRVASHCNGGQGARNAIVAGVDSIEHGEWLTEEDLDLMVEKGTFWVPTLMVSTVGYERRFEDEDGNSSEFTRKFRQENYEHAWSTFEMALSKGVKIAAGTDAAMPGVRHGDNARELELMVERGMTPMQAIVAATNTNAELFDWESDLGTIEAGKLADIVIVRGDPLQDISVLRDISLIERVIKGGETVVVRPQSTS